MSKSLNKLVALPEGPRLDQRTRTLKYLKANPGLITVSKEGDKKPFKMPAANLTQPESDTRLQTYGASTYNIGLQMSGTLLDIDDDSKDPYLAQALDCLLPYTPHVFGRASSPRSHRLYSVKGNGVYPLENGKAEWVRTPFRKELHRLKAAPLSVEVRGDKQSAAHCQMPGSVHPTGELYVWSDPNADLEVTHTTIDFDDLMQAVGFAKALALLVPHFVEGQRHDIALALSGLLWRAYKVAEDSTVDTSSRPLSKERALQCFETLLDISGDDATDRRSRVRTFEGTWTKGEAGAAIQSTGHLTRIMGDARMANLVATLLIGGNDMGELMSFVSETAIIDGQAAYLSLDALASKANPFTAVMRPEDFRVTFGARTIRGGTLEKPKTIQLTEILHRLPYAQRVAGVTIDPTGGPLVTKDGETYANAWSGFAVSRVPYTEDAIRPVLDYIRNAVCADDGPSYKWVMSWLANLFQHPEKLPGTSLMLVSERGGMGKSFMHERLLSPMLGNSLYSTATLVRDLRRDNHSGNYAGMLLVGMDEVMLSGKGADTLYNTMKALATSTHQLYTMKFKPALRLPHLTRYLMTSNRTADALHLGMGRDDRRFTVLEVSEWVSSQGSDYWAMMHKWVGERNNLNMFYSYLLDLEYDFNLVSNPHRTKAREPMEEARLSALVRFLEDAVLAGTLVSPSETPAYWELADDTGRSPAMGWPDRVNLPYLCDRLNDWCKTQRMATYSVRQLVGEMDALGLLLGRPRRVEVRDEFCTRRNTSITGRFRLYQVVGLKETEEVLKSLRE